MSKIRTRKRTSSKSIFSSWKNKIALLLITIISTGTMYYTNILGDQLYASVIDIDPGSPTLTTDIFHSLRDQYDTILDIKLQNIRAKQKLGRSCDPKTKLVSSARSNIGGIKEQFPVALRELLSQERDSAQYDLAFSRYTPQQLKTVRQRLLEMMEDPKNIINLKFSEYQTLLKFLREATASRVVAARAEDNQNLRAVSSSYLSQLVTEIDEEIDNSQTAFDLAFEFIKEENKAAITIAGLCKTGQKLRRIMKKASLLRQITESTIKNCFGLHTRSSRCVYTD